MHDLGIPKDRASRAMRLADVPQGHFELTTYASVYTVSLHIPV
jgi:hypothetical protein